jgi:hypothetical protein
MLAKYSMIEHTDVAAHLWLSLLGAFVVSATVALLLLQGRGESD